MIRSVLVLLVFLQCMQEETWVSRLENEIRTIDDQTAGEIGVYIKYLEDGLELKYKTDRNWYLASTVKIPLAIAVLQKIEKGELSLTDEVELLESDFVDSSGDLVRQKPGTKYTIATLLEKMIRNSDSVAADMLMRLIGKDEVNKQIKDKIIPKGISEITSILQVRYEAYSEVHKNAKDLSNTQIIKINSSGSYAERYRILLKEMGIDRSEARAESIDEAFEKYYKREINTGSLDAMGSMLESLFRGELLSRENSELLLGHMAGITTGDRRIKAGLPKGTRFVQKTGTQVKRIFNMGIIFPSGNQNSRPIIIVASVKNFDDFSAAEKSLERLGTAVTEFLIKQKP